jgi:hypothetical protein
MATLEAFVRTGTDVAPPANVPPAPKPGVLNVTDTPAPTRLFDESLTVACMGVANGAPMSALCPDPAVAVTLAAVPCITVTVPEVTAVNPAESARI